MRVPVIQGLIESKSQLIQVLEATTFEGQGTQLLPPGFDQVEPASVLGDELQLDLWPGSQCQLDLAAGVNTQVIFDDQPTVGWKRADHLFQQLNITGTVPSRADHDAGLSACRFKGTMHPHFPAPAIVWLKSGPVGPWFPFLARVGLDRNRTHFINTDHPQVGLGVQIRCDDAPLFSTNSGSCFSAL